MKALLAVDSWHTKCFGVDFALGGFDVPGAGHRILVDESIEAPDDLVVQRDRYGTKIFLEVLDLRGSRNRQDVVALRKYPRQCELCRRAPGFSRQRCVGIQKCQIA